MCLMYRFVLYPVCQLRRIKSEKKSKSIETTCWADVGLTTVLTLWTYVSHLCRLWDAEAFLQLRTALSSGEEHHQEPGRRLP